LFNNIDRLGAALTDKIKPDLTKVQSQLLFVYSFCNGR